ncbi:nuclease-related domain-containing protein [Alkalihalobacterium bogoriense]|uniref:nuclease-related domain-containing protein n=1 Tax=Alkalihalobacterium bogoriense TaxID=246272 RepID=UPI000A030B22|nr:nuclease-related domain-containing protein [Alkalihalobacterium bogoriense]
MQLSEKDQQYFYNLEKGLAGEKLFDSITEGILCDCLILNDLLFKHNNTTFQIDSLIVFQDCIYMFEVKNFEGDYFYESERFYKTSNSEVNNPLNQLMRSESLFRQLLQSLRVTIPLHAYVVFINPDFTLYQAPLNKPFLFPTQLNRFIKKLNMVPSKLNKKHKILADQLISLHIQDFSFSSLPSYEYDQLRKGIPCPKCKSFATTSVGRLSVCNACRFEETFEAAVMRNVHEFKLLFPTKKITTNIIHDWCNLVNSKKRINRILEKNLKIVGTHQWAYYE